MGQVMLAIGWGGIAAAFLVLAECGLVTTLCPSLPGTWLLGTIWLTGWLAVGLLVDLHLWSRGIRER